MATFKKVGSGGLWKQKGQDGSSYFSGKIKIDLAEINDVQPEVTLFFNLSKSEKRTDTSPDLWLTVKVKEEEGSVQGKLPPPENDKNEDIPF